MKKLFLFFIFAAAMLAQNVSNGPVTKKTSGTAANDINEDLNIGSGRTVQVKTGGTLNGTGVFDFSAGTLTLASNQVGWLKVNKTGSSIADLATRSAGDLNSGTLADARLSTALQIYAGISPSANVQTLLGAANFAAFKSSLSLNLVENTALSTWAGSTNLNTFASGSVTLAHHANMATASLFYRKTAGTGPPEVNSLSTLKTDLGLSGTNTGDQTITLTGEATGSGTGSFAVTLTNSAVIGKVITGYVSGAGTVVATDTILQAVQKLNGNDALKAPLASPTFTGTVGLPAGQVVNGVTLTTAGSASSYLNASGTYTATAGGDMVLASTQTNTGAKTFNDGTLLLRNAAGTFSSQFTNTNTAARTYTLPDVSGTLVTGGGTASGTNTGDQTTITGNAGSATVLQTARTINGVSFNGSANITVTAAGSTLSDSVTIGKGGTGQTTAVAARNALNTGNTALTDAATIATDCSTGNVFSVQITTNRAMGAPTNLTTGATYIWRVKQSSGGSNTLSWNAVFKWPGGTAPVLTTTANATDIISGVTDGTNIYCSFIQDVK